MTCPRCRQPLPAYDYDASAKAIEHDACDRPDVVVETLDGPDRLGRYTYFLHWTTSSPAWCSRCGRDDGLAYDAAGVASCTRCKLTGPMHRAQIFFRVPPARHIPRQEAA